MKVITIGKKLIALEQVALVEVFESKSNAEFRTDKDYKARLILLSRDAVLTEQSVEEFATEHGLHVLTEDMVAVNQAIAFRVESFEPSEGFTPAKPFKTRLKWRDLGGQEQSKLLLTAPETVITEILEGKPASPTSAKRPARRQARGRSGSRRMEAFRT